MTINLAPADTKKRGQFFFSFSGGPQRWAEEEQIMMEIRNKRNKHLVRRTSQAKGKENTGWSIVFFTEYSMAAFAL